jgi:hypothetical protein
VTTYRSHAHKVDTIETIAEAATKLPEPRLRLSTPAATFLSSEQYSLLNARSLGWNESFSRVSVFLTTLSASAVALALVADASGFGDQFTIFALVLFPIVLFLGVATHVRIVQLNLEDVYLVRAMNRVRRAYADSAPEIRQYLTAGVSDDAGGVWRTYLLGRAQPRRHWIQVLVTTPTIVATLNAVIATVGIGALIKFLGGSDFALILICVSTFSTLWAGLFSLQLRAFRTARGSVARFQSEDL